MKPEGIIRIVKGDITRLNVDAIVNAANQTLLGGGGVDGAIHRAAGPQLTDACRVLGGCHTGDAKVTPGFSLLANYVIHTVGPVWRGGQMNEPQLLASCYTRSLKEAMMLNCKSIAFPNISTGAYGFPKETAAFIAKASVESFLAQNPDIFHSVYFVCFDEENFSIYKKLFDMHEV